MTKATTEFCNDNVEICDKKMTLIKNFNLKICTLINSIMEEDQQVLRGEIDVV